MITCSQPVNSAKNEINLKKTSTYMHNTVTRKVEDGLKEQSNKKPELEGKNVLQK